MIVLSEIPDFWRCIVRCADLGLGHGVFDYFGDIEVSQFGTSI
jgi:hypothetical protein